MTRHRLTTLLLPAALSMFVGCDQPAMTNQPRLEAFEATDHFADGQVHRAPVPGTVARSEAIEAAPEQMPLAVSRELLQRGRERFDIFCSPCHGLSGHGDGIIVRRGFPAPPSLHSEHLRQQSPAHFYRVISDGFGVMYAYADRVPPHDRWAIAAYIQALQLSQHARREDLGLETGGDLPAELAP